MIGIVIVIVTFVITIMTITTTISITNLMLIIICYYCYSDCEPAIPDLQKQSRTAPLFYRLRESELPQSLDRPR